MSNLILYRTTLIAGTNDSDITDFETNHKVDAMAVRASLPVFTIADRTYAEFEALVTDWADVEYYQENDNYILFLRTGNFNIATRGSEASTDNSTSTPIVKNTTFTGAWEELMEEGFIALRVTIKADQASADNGFVVEWSEDGSTVLESEDGYTIAANTGKTFTFGTVAKYFRVKYTNGNADQTSFRIATAKLRNATKWSTHKITEEIDDETDAVMVKAVLTGQSSAGGGSYPILKMNPSGAATVETHPFLSDSSTITSVTASATAVTLLAANANRIQAAINNDSSAVCYVKYGSGASSTSYTHKLQQDDQIIEDTYNGIITAIWETATGNARITEIA